MYKNIHEKVAAEKLPDEYVELLNSNTEILNWMDQFIIHESLKLIKSIEPIVPFINDELQQDSQVAIMNAVNKYVLNKTDVLRTLQRIKLMLTLLPKEAIYDENTVPFNIDRAIMHRLPLYVKTMYGINIRVEERTWTDDNNMQPPTYWNVIRVLPNHVTQHKMSDKREDKLLDAAIKSSKQECIIQ